MDRADLAQSVVKEFTQTLPDPQQDMVELDILASDHISLDILVRERDLYRLKWFDYRHLHPVEATRLFANEYRKAHARFKQKRFDEERGFYSTGLARVDLFEMRPNVRTALWKARQFCDEMCWPYDALLFAAMKYAEERCWANPPRPEHLYSGDFAIAMREKRLEDSRIKIRLAEKPEFKADAYQGDGIQDDYQEYLIGLARQRANPEMSVVFLLESGHLLPEVAAKEFGERLVRQAIFSSK